MLSKSRLKTITTLKNKKIRNQRKLFIIEGLRNCWEAVKSDFTIETLLYNPKIELQNFYNLIEIASDKNIEIIEITESDAKKLTDTVHSQGLFAVIRQQQLNIESILEKRLKFIVIIDSGQDPGNLGTLIRTSDWFGVDALFLSSGNVELYNPKVVRATMGSIFHFPVIENVNLFSFLPTIKQKGYHIFAADVNGHKYFHEQNYDVPVALILGNENKGISKDYFQFVDHSIKIPSYGKAESLNLASAGAVLLSHISLYINSM